jgi:hypothetical protein
MQDRGSRALRACHGNDNALAMKPKLAKSHAAATAACHCAVASEFLQRGSGGEVSLKVEGVVNGGIHA